MLTLRTMIILSAVAATGIVFLTQPSHSEQTVGVVPSKIQDRHPAFNVGDALRGALNAERSGKAHEAPVATPKDDRLQVEIRDCDAYTWPHIPAACLTVADTPAASGPRRTVAVVDTVSEGISVVTPVSNVVALR